MVALNISDVKNRVSENACLCMLEGGSMRPAFRDGDLLLMKKVPPASLKTGNVIMFDSPGFQKTLIHRIIGFLEAGSERLVFTQGDRSCRPDEPVRQQFVKGRVSARLINGKFRPCRRYQEMFWLFSSRLRRSIRRFVKNLAVGLAQTVSPVLPIRVRARFRGLRI